MLPFHSLRPEVAQREVRCVHIGPGPDPGPPADEYTYVVRGELDPINEQSEFAADFLELFQRVMLDEPYRLRLRRHHRLFREGLQRRGGGPASPTDRPAAEAGG
jgi:hypothetical protein